MLVSKPRFLPLSICYLLSALWFETQCTDGEEDPEEFDCPISHGRMKESVVARDGHSYEKSKIEEWFKEHNTSPMTRKKIEPDLVPNLNLLSLMDRLDKDELKIVKTSKKRKINCQRFIIHAAIPTFFASLSATVTYFFTYLSCNPSESCSEDKSCAEVCTATGFPILSLSEKCTITCNYTKTCDQTQVCKTFFEKFFS